MTRTSEVSDTDETERSLQIKSYVLQRRILLGCTAFVVITIIIWIVAISSDNWITVSGNDGIFVPETRRYFKSSHSGVWRMCRYSVIPLVMANSSAARNFTTLARTNPEELTKLMSKIGQTEYINEFLEEKLPRPIDEIDDNFRRHLFGYWVKGKYNDFNDLKNEYYRLWTAENPPKVVKQHILDPTNVTAVNVTVGAALSVVVIEGKRTNVIVPEQLRQVLFDRWEDRDQVVHLLWAFSKAMHIRASMVSAEGLRFVIKPPPPPKKGRFANGYEYIPFKACQLHEFFATAEEIMQDLTIDNGILDYTRTVASFALITLMMMFAGFFFSIYTFMNPRYMFKRLAGGIHFITACTTMVVLQVLRGSIEYQKERLSVSFPAGAKYYFGYGYYLAWFVFIFHCFVCLTFLWASKKRKGFKAATEELGMADEPVVIGR